MPDESSKIINDIKKNIKNADEIKEDTSNEISDDEFDKRDQLYTSLVNQYVENYKSKCGLRVIFLWIVAVAFLAIIISYILFIRHILISKTDSITNYTILGSSFGVSITSLLVIPKIIAEHLFPTNDELIWWR